MFRLIRSCGLLRGVSTLPKAAELSLEDGNKQSSQDTARPSASHPARPHSFEFGQCLAPLKPRNELPFSIPKRNSYLDIFKRHKFDLSLEHKNTFLLSQFLSPTGKLLPTNVTQLSAKSFKAISKSIRRARCMGLVPYLWRRPFLIAPTHNTRTRRSAAIPSEQ